MIVNSLDAQQFVSELRGDDIDETISIKKIKYADKLFLNKKYFDAAMAYKRVVYSKQYFDFNTFYVAACAWSMAGKIDSAFKYLDSYLNSMAVPNDSIFVNLKSSAALTQVRKDKKWNKWLASEELKRKQKVFQYNVNMAEAINAVNQDSSYFNAGIKRTRLPVIELTDYRSRCKSVESKVSQVIDSFGWPQTDIYGKELLRPFLQVLNCSVNDSVLLKKIINLINQKTNNDRLCLIEKLYLEDKLLISRNLPQKNGTQVSFNTERNAYKLYPLQDEKLADKFRSAAGLKSLKDYLYDNFDVLSGNLLIEKSADISGAIEIKDSIYGPINTANGPGRKIDWCEGEGVCESYSCWFTFIASSNGLLDFDIVPKNRLDDYDFALFYCPDSTSIQAISKGENLPVRRNFSYNVSRFGSTGLATTSGRIVGAGDGPQYIESVRVNKGERFYLLINCGSAIPTNPYYHGKPSGFMLYFYNYWSEKQKLFSPTKAQLPLRLNNTKVYFDVNSDAIRATIQDSLNRYAKQFLTMGSNTIRIIGYADPTGNEPNNAVLALHRAEAVRRILMQSGIDGSRIEIKNGYTSVGPHTSVKELKLDELRRADLILIRN